MQKKTKIYVEQVVNQMIETLESGQLEPLAQYAFVDNICKEMLLVPENIGVEDAIISYFIEQDSLKNDIKNLNLQIKEKMDKVGENTREIYEELKKLPQLITEEKKK